MILTGSLVGLTSRRQERERPLGSSMNNSVPPKLFKYMPSARFLENSSFRFTQPDALDDHREALPRLVFNKYAPEDYQVAREKASAAGMAHISDDELEAF